MAESRTGAGNIQDQPEHLQCQKVRKYSKNKNKNPTMKGACQRDKDPNKRTPSSQS